MKSIIEGKILTKEKISFPVLMINKDKVNGELIVLFTGEAEGTVIHCNNHKVGYDIGEYGCDWVSALDEKEWEKYESSVRLQND